MKERLLLATTNRQSVSHPLNSPFHSREKEPIFNSRARPSGLISRFCSTYDGGSHVERGTLPHQLTAVYESMLPRQPLRILIVAPGSLVEQWRDELFEKFGYTAKNMSSILEKSAVSKNQLTRSE